MTLRIPEVPRVTSGLVLGAGGIGYALGADALSAELISSLAIVGVASSALVISGALDRQARVSRFGRRASNAEVARQFHRELLRARRRGTPLAVARFPNPGGSSVDPRSIQRRVAEFRRHLRRIDLVWVRGTEIYVLLPETDGDAAAGALRRLRDRAPAAFAAIEPVVVLFPRDGLTSGAILAAAAGRVPVGPAPAAPVVEPPDPEHVDAPESAPGRAVTPGRAADATLTPRAASTRKAP